MKTGICDHPEAENLMLELAMQLQNVSGKKSYGYLPKKQKALSSWLNQLCASTFKMPSMGVQYNETGVNAIKLPGAGALANIDMTTGIFTNDLLDAYGHDLVHDLQVSPDGKTATITQTVTADLSSPGSQINKKISFGQVTLSQRLVIDLTAEIPTVTDFQVSQEFDW